MAAIVNAPPTANTERTIFAIVIFHSIIIHHNYSFVDTFLR